jgi:hypothetical protein
MVDNKQNNNMSLQYHKIHRHNTGLWFSIYQKPIYNITNTYSNTCQDIVAITKYTDRMQTYVLCQV